MSRVSADGGEAWTILKVLDWTRGFFQKKKVDNPRLDAEVLIAHALGMERVMLYAHFDRPLDEEERTKIRKLVLRRAEGEPVAYIQGRKEFWSLDFKVTRDTLVPRPDTEVLVEVALEKLKDVEAPVIAEVGTGCGCVAVALAKELANATIFAIEISAPACAVAKENIERHGVGDRVHLIEGDLLRGLPSDAPQLDMIVGNLPYIPSTEKGRLMKDVVEFEPHVALFGGDDGMDLIRALAEQAPARQRSGGHIALEAGPDLLHRVKRILDKRGYQGLKIRPDYAGLDRVVSGMWTGS